MCDILSAAHYLMSYLVSSEIFGGGPYNAKEAASLGLIDRVQHHDQFLLEVLAKLGVRSASDESVCERARSAKICLIEY